MIDEQALREFANTLISEPVSRSIEEIECAGEFIKALLDELATMRSESAALRVTAENAEKDAARYRWLKSRPVECNANGPDLANWIDSSGFAMRGNEADEVIDNAMKETP